MKVYMVDTKDCKFFVRASSRQEAFAYFFLDILDGKIDMADIGHLIMLVDNGEEYALRTAPVLVLLEVLPKDLAISGISEMTGTSLQEAEQILDICMEEDKEMADLVLELKNK